MNPAKEIQLLKDEIDHHNYLYYALDKPEISDQEFDSLIQKLKKLEEEFPGWITPDSPTQRVGGKATSSFLPHKHSKAMLSLDNVYTEEEFLAWWNRVIKALGSDNEMEVTIEPKIDGTSLSLIYQDGLLISAATRGDGMVGEDVTMNAKTIRAIPLRLKSLNKLSGTFECRGEVYIHRSDFDWINRQAQKAGEKMFVNARNAASGSLRQKDPQITAQRKLRFCVHSHGAMDLPESHADFLETCKRYLLPVTYSTLLCQTPDQVMELYSKLAAARKTLPYEIDGIVIKINSYKKQALLGNTAKSPRWAIAFKFKAFQAETMLLGVEYSVGRTGTITPVAKVRPVECGGVTISSISLHNFDEIERLGIGLGDKILIERAGDVIPKVVRVLTPAEQRTLIPNPKFCPSCGEKIPLPSEEEVALRCPNFNCQAQLEQSILHFAGRDGMDIEGMGPAIVSQILSKKLIKGIAGLYSLKKEELLQCDLFAAKKAEKLIDHIQKSKIRPLSKLLTALGIRHVGERVAQILAKHYPSLDRLAQTQKEELTKIPEVGPIIAESIHQYFLQEKTLELIRDLKVHGVNMLEPQGSLIASPFSNKSIVITGELAHFTRSEAEKLIGTLGGRCTGTVSAKTDYLVVGNAPGSKFEKAKKLGVAILTESEFIQLSNPISQ